MFIELAEILDCPACSDGFGLVAFVAESDRRRVLRGRLGCPICEIELMIVDGAIDPGEEVSHPAPLEDTADEMALRVSALLGLAERAGSAILLGPGLGECAPRVAQMAARVEAVAVVPRDMVIDLEALASGVNPMLGLPERWPIRAGKLDGVALRAPSPGALEEAARCLAPGRRLVLIAPGPSGVDAASRLGFETLASDERTWVGTRT